MPEPKWGVAFGSINDGFVFVGPFEDDDEDRLELFAETCGHFNDEYHYFQIYSPDDFVVDHKGDHVLKEDDNA